MLRALLERVDSLQEQMGYISQELETKRKNKNEILDIKIAITEMKNAFDITY